MSSITMAVRAHQIALGNLGEDGLQRVTGIDAARDRELFLVTFEVVEVHLPRIELVSTIRAGFVLQLLDCCAYGKHAISIVIRPRLPVAALGEGLV